MEPEKGVGASGLQAVEGHLTLELGTELRSPRRAVLAINHQDIVPDPLFLFLMIKLYFMSTLVYKSLSKDGHSSIGRAYMRPWCNLFLVTFLIVVTKCLTRSSTKVERSILA